MATMHWRSQDQTAMRHSHFDNFVLRDRAFRAESAEMIPTQGVAFHAEGTDMRLHHLLCPTGLQPWDEHRFSAKIDDHDHVSIGFTWNMVRIEHNFRLRLFDKDAPLLIREI